MGHASIEVAGSAAEEKATELWAALSATGEGSAGHPEVERSAEMVIAVIGLVFSGVGVAKTLWDWWGPQRSQGMTVRVVFDDGGQVDLSTVDQAQLEAELRRRTS